MDEEQRFAFDTWGFLTIEDVITEEDVAELKGVADEKGAMLYSQLEKDGGFWSQAYVDLLDIPAISVILDEIFGGAPPRGLPAFRIDHINVHTHGVFNENLAGGRIHGGNGRLLNPARPHELVPIYFDRNAAANDETSQFLSDTLVNNPALGLSSNGAGVAAVFDPKRSVNLKVGFQQSNPEAINLSQSIYSLVEVGYVATPFPTGEGNYRVWFRSDNTTGQQATAFGVSLDQKVSPWGTLFARFGSSEADVGRDRFYSIGMGVQNGLVMNRWDTWGVGYSYSELDVGDREHVGEFYYGLGLSERLRLSLHLQYFKELPMAANTFSYLVPGVRFQAGF